MTHTKTFSGTLKGAVISDELKRLVEREVLINRMNKIAQLYNNSVSAYKITKKTHLRKAMKAKIEILYNSYQWLQFKLRKIDEVTQ